MHTTEDRAKRFRVGIIGPNDIVESARALIEREFPEIAPLPMPYASESDAVASVRDDRRTDGFLYTGIIPYTLVSSAIGHRVPAAYIPYSGATLYAALIELLSAGADLRSMSVDTLDRPSVLESFRGAGLPVEGVSVKEYAAGVSIDELVEFHLSAGASDPRHTAVTCVASVYDRLHDRVRVVRLVPAAASTRSTIENLRLELAEREAGDAQIALGFLTVSDSDGSFAPRGLAPSTFAVGPDSFLLVTTRGLLHEYTSGFRSMPLLDALEAHDLVQLGFGIGRTAADAEALARRALERSRAIAHHSSVVCFGKEREFVLERPGLSSGTSLPFSPLAASRRSGISTSTLSKLQAIASASQNRLVAADVSAGLGVELRSARRTLKQLERAGLATPVGTAPGHGAGRPSVVYALRLPMPGPRDAGVETPAPHAEDVAR